MPEIAEWLHQLGFGQYAQRFAENDIDFRVLPELTGPDLKELGVSLGHRWSLLRAIAELSSAGKSKLHATDATSPPFASQESGERRQVTGMFSDLVGSTALSARMDPEDLREGSLMRQKPKSI